MRLTHVFECTGGTTFEFTANAQIWPRALNSAIGGQEGTIYLIASDIGSNSGSGLDFISASAPVSPCIPVNLLGSGSPDGFGWLQRFYSVFDTTNTQVGIATTPYTDATTN